LVSWFGWGGWQAPDLAVGFNSGLHEDMYGTWGQTLRLIIDDGKEASDAQLARCEA
jgi:hypothetical protein